MGSAFKPFAGIAGDKLLPTAGEDSLMIFGDAASHDMRCRVCGSFLNSVVRDGAFVHVSDGLPQYEEHVVASEPGGGQEF